MGIVPYATEASCEHIASILKKVAKEGKKARILIIFDGKRFVSHEITTYELIPPG